MKLGEVCIVSAGLGAVATLAWVVKMNDKQGNNLKGDNYAAVNRIQNLSDNKPSLER